MAFAWVCHTDMPPVVGVEDGSHAGQSFLPTRIPEVLLKVLPCPARNL